MSAKETKKTLFALLLGLGVFISPLLARATDYSSANFTVENPVVDSGAPTSSSASFGLGQSLSQIAIGQSASANFQLWSGFQYYFEVKANTLTATAGDAQADLSWTTPTAFLGITVGSYEVGVGTISGSYTFTNVGNVTSFTETGLTNGITYYFRIKALSPAGNFLVFSNEASATPAGAAPTPTPTSGSIGGGVMPAAALVVSGQAYPGAIVTLVRDSAFRLTGVADSTGHFQIRLSNLSAGNHNFIAYATDAAGLRSANFNFDANLTTSITASRSDLVLSPTLTTDYTIIKQGEALTITGSAAPNAPVNISLTGMSSRNLTAQAVASGQFSYQLDTAGLDLGAYSLQAAYAFGSGWSALSLPVTFSVSDRSVARPVLSCGGRSDLNCDGAVNLIDFSILLYFWDGAHSLAANPRADIDQSGSVDIVDFSVMLYDWTG